MPYLSPYHDPLVSAGQGTVAVELTEQLIARGSAAPGAVAVAVGGGGLIGGIGVWLREHLPSTTVVGAQPANDAAMLASLEAGEVVAIDAAATFSDGTAGNLEPGAITLPLCAAVVDRWVTVEERDIAATVALMIDRQHQLVEGSAGVAIAAALSEAARGAGGPIVAVSCGANVASSTLAAMLSLAVGG